MLKLFKKKKVLITESIPYKGYDLFYSEGTSLVERIKKQGEYEPDTITTINGILDSFGKDSPTILDIGANIGIISLAILSKYPQAKIFAFEPGIHQFDLFTKTIAENQISGNVKLSAIALSDSNGEASFYIHDTEDASGDGLKDTGRAGKAKKVAVQTQKLDDWWNENNNPQIDFIKCDTEGAEYLILKEGKSLLEKCKPILVLEIFEKNLENYPFSSKDLFALIENLNYDLYSFDNELVTDENRVELMIKNAEFKALPKK